MSEKYPIQEGSIIKMGTSEDIFFVEYEQLVSGV